MTDECRVDPVLDLMVGSDRAVELCKRPVARRFLSEDLGQVQDVVDLGVLTRDEVLQLAGPCKVDAVELRSEMLLSCGSDLVVEMGTGGLTTRRMLVNAHQRASEALRSLAVRKRPE